MGREWKRREEGTERKGKDGWKGRGDRGNGTDGRDVGWDGREWKGKRRKGIEKEERGYSPQTSIPGAATAYGRNFRGAG